MSLVTRAMIVAFACALSACSIGKRIIAPNDDAADYRFYRVAAFEGVRLARAQRYLDEHPKGAWADEVRAAFDAEEPIYFDKAKESRDRVSEYLADLPEGPHAAAALALLTVYDRKVEDIATDKLLRAARRSEARFEAANKKRRAVGETILSEVGAILDHRVYGAHIDDLPPALVHALSGNPPSTWAGNKTKRERDLFFSLPIRMEVRDEPSRSKSNDPLPDERESRDVTIDLELKLEGGVVVAARVEGADMFIHWDEADLLRALDPTKPNDRSEAQFHARELLAGALESAFPADRCTVAVHDRELIARQCDGWQAIVTTSIRAGDHDVIVVRRWPP